jgi:GT2 family glycosyltransferase
MVAPDVSVIIVSYNTRQLLLSCLKSVADSRGGGDIETIVVDNASNDGSRDAVRKEFPHVRLIESKTNLGFSGATNMGMDAASGRLFLLLNSDAEVRPDGVKLLRDFMDANPEIGAAGPRLVYDDGRTQPSIDSVPNLLTEFLHLFRLTKLIPGERARRAVAPAMSKFSGKTVGTYFRTYEGGLEPYEVDCVSGACMIVRADAVEKVGGLDTSFFMYMEDMDWCVRFKEAGYKVFYVPEVEVVHHVGGSGAIDKETSENTIVARYDSRLRFFAKHRGRTALLIERFMMGTAFAIRWPLSRHRKAYGRIIKAANKGIKE